MPFPRQKDLPLLLLAFLVILSEKTSFEDYTLSEKTTLLGME
jgi:hypothetical protein